MEKIVGDVKDKNHDTITNISKYYILRKPGVATFADTIEIATIFIKTSFKDLKLSIKMQSISVFLDIAKVDDFL